MASSCCAGVSPAGSRSGDAPFGEHLQAPHANHEELVQIRSRNGQELETFQQRNAIVLRFPEDALIEFDPA